MNIREVPKKYKSPRIKNESKRFLKGFQPIISKKKGTDTPKIMK